MIKELYVDKNSGTYSDILETFGLARLAVDIMERQGATAPDTDISDKGYYYLIECDPGIDETNLEIFREEPYFPIKAIPTNQYNEEKRPSGIPLVNWDDVDFFLKAAKSGNVESAPRPQDLDILLTINPEAIQGYDGLLFRLWNARLVQPEILNTIFDTYKNRPNDFDKALSEWQKIAKEKAELISSEKGWKITPMVTGQQLYNPVQGMAHNAVKMSDTLNWQSKPKINFWLVEWLRSIGFYIASLPQLVGDRDKSGVDKDRKILVLEPLKLSYSMNSIVLNEFKKAMLPETTVRFDIMAVIRYLNALLKYYVDLEEDEDFSFEPLGRITETLVSGFHVAFYKKMGRGRSLMNLSFIAFPGWIVVQDEEDLRLYRDLLQDLERFINQFREDEKKDKGYNVTDLLQHLRDLLSANDLDALFQFTDKFPAYLLGKRQKGQKASQLSVNLIERIVMSTQPEYGKILRNEGFREIAYAIRQSTVIAQQRTAKSNEYPYQIRYGLNQDLLRKANYPADFIDKLSEFLATYSAETVRVLELKLKSNEKVPFKGQRRNVAMEDIQDIVDLIEEFGAKPVAKLLIACGYAKGHRSQPIENTTEQENE